MPKFSIIIPVYNVEKYLRECLDSVMSQTFSDWECVCVDDGSTDGSGAILDEYAAMDSRFRVFHQVNSGVGIARNRALGLASAEWITYLDADDLYTPWMLEELLKAIEEEECASLCFVASKLLLVNRAYKPEPRKTSRIIVHDCRRQLPNEMWQGLWQYAYRRSLLGDIRFADCKICEDRLYISQCLVRSRYVVESTALGYIYRQRDGSAMRSSWSARKVLDSIFCNRQIVRILLQSGKEVTYHFSSVNSIIEAVPMGIIGLVGAELEKVLIEWTDALKEIRGVFGLSYVNRFRLWLFLVCDNRLSLLIFACLPYVYKRYKAMFKARLKCVPFVKNVIYYFKSEKK